MPCWQPASALQSANLITMPMCCGVTVLACACYVCYWEGTPSTGAVSGPGPVLGMANASAKELWQEVAECSAAGCSLGPHCSCKMAAARLEADLPCSPLPPRKRFQWLPLINEHPLKVDDALGIFPRLDRAWISQGLYYLGRLPL